MGLFKKTKNSNIKKIFDIEIPPPPTKEIIDLRLIVSQLNIWCQKGNKELEIKHWEILKEFSNKRLEDLKSPSRG